MKIPRKDPPSEATAKRERIWEYTQVPGGAKVRGWLAGTPFWVPVHELKKTRPCRAEITGGTLVCSVDHAIIPVVWRGYLPWWDEKYRPRGVWVSTPLKEYLHSLPEFAPIVITRPKGDKRPLDVTLDDLRAVSFVGAAHRVWPADPSPTLLTMWKDLDLSKWCRDQGGHGSVPTDTPAGEALTREIAASLGIDPAPAGDTPMSPAERNRVFVESVKNRRNGQQ